MEAKHRQRRRALKQSLTSALKGELRRVSHGLMSICGLKRLTRNKQSQIVAFNEVYSSLQTSSLIYECTISKQEVCQESRNNVNMVKDCSKEEQVTLGIDDRAEEFIRKFYEQLQIQREESIEEFYQMLARSC